jgi:hypothetical protein
LDRIEHTGWAAKPRHLALAGGNGDQSRSALKRLKF